MITTEQGKAEVQLIEAIFKIKQTCFIGCVCFVVVIVAVSGGGGGVDLYFDYIALCVYLRSTVSSNLC